MLVPFLEEFFNLVDTVSCGAGSRCILASVIICVGKEGLEVGPSFVGFGLTPPLHAGVFEEACFLDDGVAFYDKQRVVNDCVAACSEMLPFHELFVESFNGGGRVPVGGHAVVVGNEISLCDLAIGVPEVGEELERRDVIVAGDLVC